MPEFERRSGDGYLISPLDHDIACRNVIDSTFSNPDIYSTLSALAIEHRSLDPEAYDELLGIGHYLVPRGVNGGVSEDTTMHEVYSVGMHIALSTLKALSEQLNIDVDIFHKAWRTNGLVTLLDVNSGKIRDLSLAEKREAMAMGIVQMGHRNLDQLGPEHKALLEATSHITRDVAANPSVFMASYGYIFGAGLKALTRIVETLEVRRLSQGFEAELDTFMKQQPEVMIDRRSMSAQVNHTELAEAIDTRAFYETTAEVFFASLVENYRNTDEKTVDILNTLAAVIYPNGLDDFSLGEQGNAFFLGTLVGLYIQKEVASKSSIDVAAFTRRWRGGKTHNRLYKIQDISEGDHLKADEHVSKVLERAAVPQEYEDVLLKLSDACNHEDDRALAFAEGFYYLMSTGQDAINSCINATISKQVKQGMSSFDDELKQLLDGPD